MTIETVSIESPLLLLTQPGRDEPAGLGVPEPSADPFSRITRDRTASRRPMRERRCTPPRRLLLCAGQVLLLLALCGCDRRSSAPYTKAKPNVSDLVGVWEFDAATRKRLKGLGYRPTTSRVILRGNGTFSKVNMPDCWFEGYGQKAKFHSGSGTWELSRMQGRWIVAVWFDEIDGQKLLSEKTPGLPQGAIYLRRESPPYLLYGSFGDADRDQGLFFERTSEDPNAGQAPRQGNREENVKR